jgi:hypothetical protein
LTELWAWGWAGQDSEHLDTSDGPNGLVIDAMTDLSGNGNSFTGHPNYRPGTQTGISLPGEEDYMAWSTSLPLIGLGLYVPGQQLYGAVYTQSQGMNASGDFHLVVAWVNTRSGGLRQLFGSDADNHVTIDQGTGRLYLMQDGQQTTIAGSGVPKGSVVLEISRNSSDVIEVVANGESIGNGSTVAGTFDVNGFGWDASGTSYFDDFVMELVYCDALPSTADRGELREYLRAKWNLYAPE